MCKEKLHVVFAMQDVIHISVGLLSAESVSPAFKRENRRFIVDFLIHEFTFVHNQHHPERPEVFANGSDSFR